MAAPAFQGWQQQLLQQIGAPTTPQNLSFVDAWLHAEGGTASNNPFNTTQSSPGASNYNSVGVKNYGSPQAGLAATVATLQNGRYQPILDSLRRGNNAQATADALVASPWGTKHIYLNGSQVSPQSPQLPAAPAAVAPPIPQPASGVGASSSTLPLLQLISANQQANGLPGLSPLLLAAAAQTTNARTAAPTAPAVAAAPPTSPPSSHASPSQTTGQSGSYLPGIAEAFYDPLGSYDNGAFGGAIGGHSDHDHFSFSDPQTALRVIALAQKMGLAVRENPYVDPVDPVHVKGSYHYRTFPGTYNGKRLGEAADISGPPSLMAQIYKIVTGHG